MITMKILMDLSQKNKKFLIMIKMMEIGMKQTLGSLLLIKLNGKKYPKILQKVDHHQPSKKLPK